MIRPTTVLCMIAAFGSGLYLYAEKHRTEMLDREIGHVFRATEAAHERTGLLRAEWAVLNEPGRLQELSDRYLQLKPMAPTQFVQLAELQNHLPAPVAQPPAGSTDDDDAEAPAATPVAAAADVPAPPEGTAPTETPKLVAKAEPKPHPESHHVALASSEPMRDAMTPRGRPLPLAVPQPVRASYMSAMARAPRPAPRAAIVAAVPSYPTAAPYVGSLLGGRSSLPPPVPYGSAQ